LYLVTRPGFVANREQIVEDLWPDADPSSGTNNLNQSLYFLRREVDPWYDDDLSVDYVGFHGELVWLEQDMVLADSVNFVRDAHKTSSDARRAQEVLETYTGAFAPEFEYEDWAIAWRSRVHSTFLEFTNSTIDQLVRVGDLRPAVQVAAHALEVDPGAGDVERRLIWLYAQLGLESAARAQHGHLSRAEETDGLDVTPLTSLTNGPLPDA